MNRFAVLLGGLAVLAVSLGQIHRGRSRGHLESELGEMAQEESLDEDGLDVKSFPKRDESLDRTYDRSEELSDEELGELALEQVLAADGNSETLRLPVIEVQKDIDEDSSDEIQSFNRKKMEELGEESLGDVSKTASKLSTKKSQVEEAKISTASRNFESSKTPEKLSVSSIEAPIKLQTLSNSSDYVINNSTDDRPNKVQKPNKSDEGNKKKNKRKRNQSMKLSEVKSTKEIKTESDDGSKINIKNIINVKFVDELTQDEKKNENTDKVTKTKSKGKPKDTKESKKNVSCTREEKLETILQDPELKTIYERVLELLRERKSNRRTNSEFASYAKDDFEKEKDDGKYDEDDGLLMKRGEVENRDSFDRRTTPVKLHPLEEEDWVDDSKVNSNVNINQNQLSTLRHHRPRSSNVSGRINDPANRPYHPRIPHSEVKNDPRKIEKTLVSDSNPRVESRKRNHDRYKYYPRLVDTDEKDSNVNTNSNVNVSEILPLEQLERRIDGLSGQKNGMTRHVPYKLDGNRSGNTDTNVNDDDNNIGNQSESKYSDYEMSLPRRTLNSQEEISATEKNKMELNQRAIDGMIQQVRNLEQQLGEKKHSIEEDDDNSDNRRMALHKRHDDSVYF